jgi:NitT/TauT family transport system substrate-binding protein
MKAHNSGFGLKRTAGVLLAGLLAISAAGCAADSDGSSDGALEHVSFGLPTAMAANNAPMAVAVGLGYFEEEGLDVEIVFTGASNTTVQAVLSNQLDIGSATPEPVLQLAESGGEFGGVKMIYNYIRKPTGGLAVLDDSKIESLEDFKGVTIGDSSLSSGNLLLANAILSSVDLEEGRDFSHLAVGTGAAALQALTSGDVQALSLWDTEYAAMENQGGVSLRVLSSPEAENLFSTTYFASPKYIEENTETVEAFGRAMAKATYFTSLNPEAALQVMYEEFPETRTAGLSEEEQIENNVVALNARLEVLLAGDPAANMNWGSYDPEAVADWVAFALDTDLIEADLDVDSLYTNDMVDAYNDFDVEAIEEQAESWGTD